MACFADINVSQGTVATHARSSGIFDIHLTAKLPRNLPVKMFFLIGYECVTPLFLPPSTTHPQQIEVMELERNGHRYQQA